MKIYFVRHGKTAWNLEGKIQGWENSELLPDDDSPERAAKQLEGIEFDLVCSSDLKRAIITKERILNILGLNDNKVEYKEFREVGFGKFEGANIDEVKKNYSELWSKFKLQIPDFDPGLYIEGFESVKKVKDRAMFRINELKKQYGNDSNILVVSHGSFITVMQNINKKLEEPVIIPENGSVTILEF